MTRHCGPVHPPSLSLSQDPADGPRLRTQGVTGRHTGSVPWTEETRQREGILPLLSSRLKCPNNILPRAFHKPISRRVSLMIDLPFNKKLYFNKQRFDETHSYFCPSSTQCVTSNTKKKKKKKSIVIQELRPFGRWNS